MQKKFFAVAAFALAFAFAFSASAAYDFGSTTLKPGSKGAAVSQLQSALNACNAAGLNVDGIYGKNQTEPAVKAFQASKGLTSDGLVGFKTKAALNSCGSVAVDTTPSTVPGCSAGALFSSTTGAACTTASTVPGCSAGALFSSTTGAACSTTTTMSPSSAEGYLTNINRTGAVNNAKIPEGQSNVQVMSVEVTAKDADQKIDGLVVNFKNSALRFTRGAGEVSVWLNDTKLASKSASEWSSDSNGYDYRFSGMNGIVAKDQKAILYVAVSGLSSFDTSDVTGTWTAMLNTISAVSPNGRYKDYTPASSTTSFTFEKSGSLSSDVKYKVTTSATNPIAQNVQVSNTGDTADKTLLAFDVKAENGVMVLQKLPILLTAVNGGADATAPNLEAIVKSAKLYANGTPLANETIPTGTAATTVYFGNTSKLNYTINKDATVKFEVRVDLNDVENTGLAATDFDNGDKISATYSDVAYGGLTVVELPGDGNYIQNRSGSATGELQTLRSTGVQVTAGAATSDTPITTTSGEILSRTVTIPVTVQAFEDTAYIARVVENAATPSASQAFAFQFEDSAGAVKTITNSATISSANATIEGSAYRIDAGTSKTFNVSVTMSGTAGHAIKQYRVQLEKVQNFTDAALSTGANLQVLSPSNAYETGYFTLSLN